MVCTSITVAPPPLVITGITAVPSTDPNYPASSGWVLVTVSATGQGTFTVSVDGTVVKTQGPVNAGTGSSWGFQIQMSVGTHNVCAQVV